MVTVRPFAALRPARHLVAEVIAPPYDVVDRSEAAALAQGKPHSFLHVSRAEIDLPDQADPYHPDVYARARVNLEAFVADGVLVRDGSPTFTIYRQTMGGRSQTGLVATVSIDEYAAGLIKKHELTTLAKEADRIAHFDAADANTEPIFLTYRAAAAVREIVDRWVAQHAPDMDVTANDGVAHQLWIVADPAVATAIAEAFAQVPALYIADGHHRAASAAKVGQRRRAAVAAVASAAASVGDVAAGDTSAGGVGGGDTGARGAQAGDVAAGRPGGVDAGLGGSGREFDYVMAVLFPSDELGVFDYNRVVHGLNGLSPREFLTRLADAGFEVVAAKAGESAAPYRPKRKGEFGMFLAGNWYAVRARTVASDGAGVPIEAGAVAGEDGVAEAPGLAGAEVVAGEDGVAGLDVSILQDRVLAPILGIANPRADARIEFVGGIRGLEALAEKAGADGVAFALHPVSVEDLMRVADAGAIMPPKSTWFEPKLASGLFVHELS
jgi:uncharacterized protein (DUF1015 family)